MKLFAPIFYVPILLMFYASIRCTAQGNQSWSMIYFEPNSYSLSQHEIFVLDSISNYISNNDIMREYGIIHLHGYYTDDEYRLNPNIGVLRSNAIGTCFASNGIDPRRILIAVMDSSRTDMWFIPAVGIVVKMEKLSSSGNENRK